MPPCASIINGVIITQTCVICQIPRPDKLQRSSDDRPITYDTFIKESISKVNTKTLNLSGYDLNPASWEKQANSANYSYSLRVDPPHSRVVCDPIDR